MKQLRILFSAMLLIALNAHGSAQRCADIREALLEGARKSKDFPDGKDVVLTGFHYVCRTPTKDGDIYVVNEYAVLGGMPSPRGHHQILVFGAEMRVIQSISFSRSHALWCDKGKIYLWGAQDGTPSVDCSSNNCNVIDFSAGYKKVSYRHEKAYGSSGGINEN